MTILILGLLVWSTAHLFKRVAPDARAGIGTRLGVGPSKGVFAVAIVLGLILMIFGYRAAAFTPVYTPPAWGVHVNNLAMLAAVALFGMGASKGRARSWLRNPMLTGVLVWAGAHLLVNGDVASIVLFGGLAVWSVVNMLVINQRAGVWVRPAPGPASGDLRLAIITLVAYAIVTAIHAALGVWPFGG